MLKTTVKTTKATKENVGGKTIICDYGEEGKAKISMCRCDRDNHLSILVTDIGGGEESCALVVVDRAKLFQAIKDI